MPNFILKNNIRQKFATQLHRLYKSQTPLYSKMESIVATSNANALLTSRSPFKAFNQANMAHGAIRLASLNELRWVQSAFAPLEMKPLGYYDLSPAGLPIHATAFTPLQPNPAPFRMFTSVLNVNLLPASLKEKIEPLIKQRQIFSDPLRELIEIANKQDGLTEEEAEKYVFLLADAFKFSYDASISYQEYCTLLKGYQGPLIADIFAFPFHLNHCTPRAIDIEEPHHLMQTNGMKTISKIQGPPAEHDILLRQTSYQAVNMLARFTNEDGSLNISLHRACFGEIEQRGAAVTPKGYALYEKCLAQNDFSAFPIDLNEATEQELIYCKYILSSNAFQAKCPESLEANKAHELETLLQHGLILRKPILFEEFLPVSAAKIFESNLKKQESTTLDHHENSQKMFEQALDMKIIDPHKYYEQQQALSINAVYKKLHLQMPKKLQLKCNNAINRGPLPSDTETQTKNHATLFTHLPYKNTTKIHASESDYSSGIANN